MGKKSDFDFSDIVEDNTSNKQQFDFSDVIETPVSEEPLKKKEQPSLMGVNLPSPLASESGTSVLENGKSGQVNPIKDLSAVKQNIKNLFLDTEDKTYDDPRYRDSFYKSLETSGKYSPVEVNDIKSFGEKVATSKPILSEADKKTAAWQDELKFIQDAKNQRSSDKESPDYKDLEKREKEVKSRYRNIADDAGKAQLKMGDTDAAISTFSHALNDEYKGSAYGIDSDLLYNLASAYQKKGDDDNAIKYYNESAKKTASNSDADKALSLLYLKNGNKEAAAEYMKIAEQKDEKNKPEKTFDWLDLTNNNWSDVLEKVIAYPQKFVGTVYEQGVNGLEKIANSSNENSLSKVSSGMLAGASQTVMSGLNLVSPELAGLTVSQEILPEKLLQPLLAPVTTIAGINEHSSQEAKDWAQVGDLLGVVGAMAGLHKFADLTSKKSVEKFSKNEPINETDLENVKTFVNENQDLIQPASEKIIQDAHKEPELPEHIVELQNKLSKAQEAFDKAPNEQVAAVHEKAVSALQDKLAEEGAKMDEENFIAAHSDATALKIQDDISALKEGLKGEDDPDLIAGIENEIGKLEKQLPEKQEVLKGTNTEEKQIKISDTKRQVIREAVKKPKIISDTKRILSDPPANIQEGVLHFFLEGGRVNTEEMVRELGLDKKSREYRSKIWAHGGKKSKSIDQIIEHIGESLGRELSHDEQSDVRNEIIDVLHRDTKGSMLNELLTRELEAGKGEYAGLSDADMEQMMNLREKHERLLNEVIPNISAEEQGFLDHRQLDHVHDVVNDMDLSELDKMVSEAEMAFDENGNIDEEKIRTLAESKPQNGSIQETGTNPGTEEGTGNKVPVGEGGAETTEGKGSPNPTTGEVKAQSEYDAGLIDIETRLSEAKQAKQNKLNKLNKNTDLFGSEAKTDELFGSDQDLSPENIKEQLKPFDEKISLLEKEKNDFIGNKEEFLKKHEGQAEIGEEERLTGLRKIADDIRNGKIDDDITMAGVPFAKEVWNAALEATATALEAGADIADAIKDGIAYIKNTDWYKNLSAEDQAKAESKFDKEMNSRPLTEEEKRVVTEEVNKGYNKKESEWLGNKEYDEHKASVEADNLQTEIKNTVPRNKSESELSYKKRWTKTDQAIHVYLDLKAKPEDLAKFYDKLTPEQKEIVDLSQNLTPEQKAIAEKISTEYQKTGQEALDAGQIKNILDNYVARSWDFKGKPPTDIAPFKTSTRHNLQRTLTSILEGWSKGYDLKLKGATTNLQTLKVEIGHAIENKNFIEQGSKIKTAEGEPLFSTHQAEGYEKIDNPSFKKWEYAGKVNDFTADQIQVFGKRKDILITTDGTVMKKSDVYAPKDVAKGLNNILGKSFLNNFAAVRAISNFSNAVKSTLFGTSFFHHAAFARAHMLASENTGLGDISPRAAYKKGQQLIHEFSPEVKMLVENGLTLGKQQEYDEVINENKSLLSRKMDKYNFAPKQREYLSDLSERQNRFLFEKYGAGLKAFDGINMLRKLAKDKPEIDITEHAQNVARFLNQNYGGLNLKRMKRNPTTQHAMRLLLLAPDWTESNLQMAADAFRKGTMGDFSRKMWGRVAMRGMAAVTLANLVTTMGDQKDDNGKDISFADAIKRRYKKAWDEGRLRFLEWDITPIIRSMGGQEDKRYYFSFYGHFSDPIKMISNPTDFLENKLNPSVTKPGFEALTGENWKHEKFTKFSELMGIDDKGIYSKSQKAHEKGQIGMTGKPYKRDAKEFKKGEEKGGKLIGHLTSRSYEPHGGIGLEEAPSFALSQARGMIPTQVQNLEMWATGENDAVYSIAQSLGLGLKISSDKKDEELKKKK